MNGNTTLATRDEILPADIAEKVLVQGDLAGLTAKQRLAFYNARCGQAGLDPVSRPFDYITFQGKLTLYANKGAAEQLRQSHQLSITRIDKQVIEGILTVTVYGELPNGRRDADEGAISVSGLKGDALANAIKKAITQAKRRLTFSMCGLNMLDETEIEQIAGAYKPTFRDVTPTADSDGVVAGTEEELEFDIPTPAPSEGHPRTVAYDEPGPDYEQAAPRATQQQRERIGQLGLQLGYDDAKIEARVRKLYGVPLAELNQAQADNVLDLLAKAAQGRKVSA